MCSYIDHLETGDLSIRINYVLIYVAITKECNNITIIALFDLLMLNGSNVYGINTHNMVQNINIKTAKVRVNRNKQYFRNN